jgi:hypothetical protein
MAINIPKTVFDTSFELPPAPEKSNKDDDDDDNDDTDKEDD